MPEDFSDRISPMIVKEVRQGLRSRSFIVSFLLLHTALVLWSAGFLSDTGGSKSGADGIFWTILGVGLLVIVFRAQSAVRGERDGRTLELLQLTRLSAWNIVAGKWCSLMVEALVVIAGVLPYFVLRYYFGTLRILEDSAVILALFVACGLVAAFMTMISCFGKVIGGMARVGSFLFFFFFGVQALVYFAVGRGGHMGMGISGEPGQLALMLLLAVPYAMIFLGVAASSVASASENIATRQRLWGLALFVPALIAVMVLTKVDAMLLFGSAMPGFALVALDCALRRSNTSLPAYASGFGRSRWRRAFATLFAPSHGAGLLFLILAWGALLLPDSITGSGLDGKTFLGAVSVLNLLLLPVALAMFLRRFLRLPYAARFWISVAMLTLPVAMLGSLCLGSLAGTARALMTFLPLGILVNLGSGETDGKWVAVIAGLHTVLWLRLLGPFVVRDFRAVRKMMRGERVELPEA